MSAPLPSLEVHGPEGQSFTVELGAERVAVGRLAELNPVALLPDPQRLVSRQAHCLIEREQGSWWLVDNGSVNGTFVRIGTELVTVEGRQPLTDGTVVCILGLLTDSDEPRYWELIFRDPLKTRRVGAAPRAACVEYDWAQAKLYLVGAGGPREIGGLRPQEHKLVSYMARRNRDNGGVPVLCAHQELLAAIWDDDALNHTTEELNRLAWELRRKLPSGDLLQTERGLGYRLNTCRRAR